MFQRRASAYPHTFRSTAASLVITVLATCMVGIFPQQTKAETIRVVLTSGTTWMVPGDWNPNSNSIEVIAGGGGGGGVTSGSTRAGSSGGGGAYSRVDNVDVFGTLTFSIGSGGAAGTASSNGGKGGDTYLCFGTGSCTNATSSAVLVSAVGGTGAGINTGGTPGVGGAASDGIGGLKYNGGNGSTGTVGVGSGGGGGAGGPNGAGGDGSTSSGGTGGGGSGGAGGGLNAVGGNGTEWTTAGSGGGGGVRTTENGGLAGGSYGGGGGGSYSTGNNRNGGDGAQGVIVITYESSGPPFGVHTTIDATANASDAWGAGRRIVFTSGLNGYAFYRDSGGGCVYAKTTNGGLSWGSAVVLDAQTDCFGITVWYDRWTPGDTTGNYIHIAMIDTGDDDIWYTRLDTSNDSLSTTISPTAGAGIGARSLNTSANWTSITKATDGELYVGVSDNSGSYVLRCSTTCTTNSNWSQAGTNPMDDADGDMPILLPLSGGNILLINFDDSADDVRSKVWSDSGAAWDSAWATVDANATNNTTYDSNISATVNSDGTMVYLAYLADVATIDGNDDDLRTATYSGGSWTSATAVETNTQNGLTSVSIGLIGSGVYVVYGVGAVASFYLPCIKASHDSMSTWRFSACYTSPAPAVSGRWDMKDVSVEARATGGAIASVWFDDTGDDQIFLSFPEFSSSNTLTFTRDVSISGGIAVLGGVSKGGGTFVIDHPLDPQNKLLFHSFVESPDVKNIYDGIVELNGKGEATIELPGYLLALNKDFRYLATAMGVPMPELHLKKEVAKRWWIFGRPVIKIAGGAPNGRVSWQVTGIRQDPLIEAHPIQVEVDKGGGQIVEKGECIHEPLCE